MKVQGKRLRAGESFTVPGLAPVERLAALEEQRELIEAEIAKAAEEVRLILHESYLSLSRRVLSAERDRDAELHEYDRVCVLAGHEAPLSGLPPNYGAGDA